MQLMVDAPKTFEQVQPPSPRSPNNTFARQKNLVQELISSRTTTTADQRRQRIMQHVGDVQDILDQSALEQGGSFDSDMTFCRSLHLSFSSTVSNPHSSRL